MIRVAVLISGNGTNLQAIIDDSQSKGRFETCPYKIVLVLSNKKNALGLARAQKVGIPTKLIQHNLFESRELFDKEMARAIDDSEADLVVLAGFMRILSPQFVRHFKGRLINIHPSLLPKFTGTNAIAEAWHSNAESTGVTIHFVDEGVDTGPIIRQRKISLKKGESLENLEKRIHEVEYKLYPEVIREIAKGKNQA